MNNIKIVEEKVKDAINDIADNDKLEKLEQIDIIKEWHDKVGDKRDKREIIKYIIPKIIEHATPYLLKVFIENLSVKNEFIRNEMISDIEFDLTPIKPYVDIVLKADSAKIHSIRFTFQIDTHVNISNLKFVKDKTLDISIDIIKFIITLSLIKIVNDIEPLELGTKEFAINDLSLSL